MKARDKTLPREISRAVETRRERSVQLLQALVRTPSVSGEEAAVQEVVEGAFEDLGLTIERCRATAEQLAPYREHVGDGHRLENRPSVVGVRKGGGTGRSILLNAHVDTVDAGDPAAWTYPPFSGKVVGDRLYGRGACDMKGGLATFIAALGALGDLGIALEGDLIVAATVGEEDSGVGSLATILAGHRADAVVISEPTRLALVPAQAGSLVFRLTVTGSAVHAAERSRGTSAFEKFLPIFRELQNLERDRRDSLRHPLYEGLENRAAINVGVVRAGNWAVTVPEKLVAEGRIGLLPGEELASSKAYVEERILAVADRDPWLREHPPKLDWPGAQSVPAETPLDSPICRAVARAHEKVTGHEPAVVGANYGADMRLFVRIGEMPCVMYGAGDVGRAHGPDEYIGIGDLLTATKTLACLLIDWCGLTR